MKLLIFEGPDNIGKSTIIQELKKYLISVKNIQDNKIYILHFLHPSGHTKEEQIKNIDEYNISVCNQICEWYKENLYDYVILDRSWYSEYVYGQIYRNRTELSIRNNINNIELKLCSILNNNDIYIFNITTNNIDFLISNEDGNSLSKSDDNNKMKKLINKEILLFNNEFSRNSIIPQCYKIEPIINNKFKDRNEIINEIIKVL